jgi:hypothetical protein
MIFRPTFKKIMLLLCCLQTLCTTANAQEMPNDERVDTAKARKADPIKPPKQFKFDNTFVGSDFNFAFLGGLYFHCAPYAGYRIKDMLALAVGFSYTFSQTPQSRGVYEDHRYGVRAFARLRPFGKLPKATYISNLYGHLELENMNQQVSNPNYNQQNPTPGVSQYQRGFIQTAYVGIGYTSNFGKGFGVTMDFLYPLWTSVPFTNIQRWTVLLSYRIGVYAGF